MTKQLSDRIYTQIKEYIEENEKQAKFQLKLQLIDVFLNLNEEIVAKTKERDALV